MWLRIWLRAMTINGYLAKSSVVAALGGLLFGFDTAVIAGVGEALKVQYSLTPAALVQARIDAFAAEVGERLGRLT